MGQKFKENLGKAERKDHLKDLGVDEMIILKWALTKQDETMWTELICLQLGTCGGILRTWC
jgi:hypothetical protein